eukprot:62498-Prymnesium_polylepis.1
MHPQRNLFCVATNLPSRASGASSTSPTARATALAHDLMELASDESMRPLAFSIAPVALSIGVTNDTVRRAARGNKRAADVLASTSKRARM